MQSTETTRDRTVLVLCNLAGMIDLVALPLWVGSLMQSHTIGPQQAGLMVTCYILALFASSLFFSRRFGRIDGRRTAALGFLVGSAAFAGLSQAGGMAAMVALHAVAGLGAGCGLSLTHGTIARSGNPHRLFALAGFGTGAFAIAFFVVMPGQLAIHGARLLFAVLAALLLAAALAAAVAFPRRGQEPPVVVNVTAIKPSVKWLAFVGVACLATTQAMIFGFMERAGVARGFAPEAIGIMLAVGGVVNLTAPIAATLLDRRICHYKVAIVVLPVHAALGAAAMLSDSFLPYAVTGDLFVWMIIFGHNFMFSLIAKLDPTGRTAASTPAMLMIGSAVGPLLGGTLAEAYGYASLAVAAGAIASGGTLCFVTLRGQVRRTGPLTQSVLEGAD